MTKFFKGIPSAISRANNFKLIKQFLGACGKGYTVNLGAGQVIHTRVSYGASIPSAPGGDNALKKNSFRLGDWLGLL